MKQGLLIFLFLFNSILIYGQDKWCHYYTTLHGLYYEMGEFCGDTIINNKKYDIVVTSLFRINDLTFLESRRKGFRRISNDSIFYLVDYDMLGIPEELYYVYNLKVNDKIVVSAPVGDTLKVLNVDTVNLLGKERRRIYLSNENKKYENHDIWIEGIGTILHGYLWPGLTSHITDLASSFSCYYDSVSGQTYSPYDSLPCHLDKLVKVCSIPTSNKRISEKVESIISPNPFNNSVEIKTREDHIDLSLYNANGELLKFLSYFGNHKTLDCDELALGVYIIKLKIGKELDVIKIVKN